MLGVPKVADVLHNDRGDGEQPADCRSRIVEPTHMRVAGSEKAVWHRVAWVLLEREEQLWHGLFEAPAEEMRLAYSDERRADAGARTEAQRGLVMLDRDVRLARPIPQGTAEVPA